MGERRVVVVCSPFTKVVGDVVGERVRGAVLEVDDDQRVMGRLGRRGRVREQKEVSVLSVVV